MEKELSIINESDMEKSEASLSVIGQNFEKSKVSHQTEDNYEFLKNFHSKYEKKETESNSYQNFLDLVTQPNTNKIENPNKNANFFSSLINVNNNDTVESRKNSSKKNINEFKENMNTQPKQTSAHFNSFLSLVSNSTKRDSQTPTVQEISEPNRKSSSPDVLPESPKTFRKSLFLSKPEKDRRQSTFTAGVSLMKNKISSLPKTSLSTKVIRRNSMIEKNEPKNFLEEKKNLIVKNNPQFTLTTLNAGGGLKRRFTITENINTFKFDTLVPEPTSQENKDKEDIKSSENNKGRLTFAGRLSIIEDMDLKNKISSLNLSPKKSDSSKDKENMLNPKKQLTLDQVVEEINKPYITFSKRRPSLSAANSFFNVDIEKIRQLTENENKPTVKKKEKFKKSSSKLSSSEQQMKQVSNSSKFESSIFENKKKAASARKAKNFRRIKIFLHVFSFISFTKKEIITYGIKPKSRKPVVERDTSPHFLRSEYSILNFTMNENMHSYKILNEKNLANKAKIKWYIISPDEIFYKLWRRLYMGALIFFSIFSLYRMSFSDTYFNPDEVFFYLIDFTVELIFMIDFVLNFFLAYYDYEGNLIIDFKKIAYSFFSSIWMMLDLFTLIPFYFISLKYFVTGVLQ
jgi:hypothetical protein